MIPCSPFTRQVFLPAALAAIGPQVYLPLLAFAGGFPTTLLYGLLPPVAALQLARGRRAATAGGEAAVVSDPPAASASAEGGVEASPVDGTPDSERLLSDGTHWAVALTAVALLATSAMSYGLPA